MRVVEYICDRCNSLINGPVYKGEFFRVDREDEEQIYDRNWWFAEKMGKAHICEDCLNDIVKMICPDVRRITVEPADDFLPFEEPKQDARMVDYDFGEELADAIAEDIEEINKEIPGEPEEVKPVPKIKKTKNAAPTDFGKLAALLNAGWKAKDLMVEFGWSSHQSVSNNKAKLIKNPISGLWEVPDELK